tara:strand:+ start:224 stop:1018 length:795 start_codon:yes stop_codon:yes gene_type:complete
MKISSLNNIIKNNSIALVIISSYERSYLWHDISLYWNRYNKKVKIKKYIFSNYSKKKFLNGFQILASDQDKNWSKRNINNLSKIKEKNIILLLDDFLLYQQTNYSNLSNSLNFFSKNKIKYLRLSPFPYDNIQSDKNIYLVPDYAFHKINLQISIWNKSFLKCCLKNSKNPWSFEINNSYKHRKSTIFSTNFVNFYYYEIINKDLLIPFLPKIILKKKIIKKIKKRKLLQKLTFFFGLLKFKLLYALPHKFRYNFMKKRLKKKI